MADAVAESQHQFAAFQLRRLAFFVACLSVGVAAVVAVAGLSSALDDGIQAQARQLLAADLAGLATVPAITCSYEETEALRIALLGYRSQPHAGGQGVYLRYLSKALADAGHEVTLGVEDAGGTDTIRVGGEYAACPQ